MGKEFWKRTFTWKKRTFAFGEGLLYNQEIISRAGTALIRLIGGAFPKGSLSRVEATYGFSSTIHIKDNCQYRRLFVEKWVGWNFGACFI